MEKAVNWIRTLNRWVEIYEATLLVILLGGLTVFAALDVFLGFFDQGLEWINRFFGYAMVWLGLIGASLATKENRHINIDIASRFLPARIGNPVKVVLHLFAAWVSFVFARESWFYLWAVERQGSKPLLTWNGETLLGDWVLFFVIPVAFATIALRFIGHAVNFFMISLGRWPAPQSEGEVSATVAEVAAHQPKEAAP